MHGRAKVKLKISVFTWCKAVVEKAAMSAQKNKKGAIKFLVVSKLKNRRRQSRFQTS